MHEGRHAGRPGSSASTVAARPVVEPIDDWLGEIFDDDWSEAAGRRRGHRHGVADDAFALPPESRGSESPHDRPSDAPAPDARESRRMAVERRRIVTGLALATVVALAAGAGVIVVRGGEETAADAVTEPATGGQTDTGASSSPTGPEGTSTEPATTTPSDTSTETTTTPSSPDTSAFTLPEGTKLRVGEDAEPAVVTDLQQALQRAGYDPGPTDGTYGQKTRAAVVAFQQANGLSADGVVGPDTAAALNEALAAG